jgi:Tfp pilus assembly protein FimT
MPWRRAFSVFEVVIVICIISALTAVVMPPAARLIDRVQVRGAVVDIESAFGSARHIAIARMSQPVVEIDTAADAVYVTLDGDTLRKRNVGAEHGVQLYTTRARMSYSATGLGYGAANLSVVVRRNSAVDTVFVSRLGRLRH